jgi:pimeloyl-ACP methyl ester carboxylesterase
MDNASRQTNGEWTPQAQWANLDGPVHYVDYDGPGTGPPLVLIHGLGGSLVSWAALAPVLARTARVLAIDLAGFGRTRSSTLSASLPANRDLLHRFLIHVAGMPAVLVGHSMGGTIAAMEASKNPETVAGLVLISPVVPWVRDEIERRLGGAFTTIGQAIKFTGRPERPPLEPAEMTPGRTRQGRARESKISAHLLGQYFAVLRARGWGQGPRAELITAGRSLTWTLLHRQQFAVMLSGLQAPVLWLHGDRDPLIPVGVARAIVLDRAAWSFHAAPSVGHDPHREAPNWTAERIGVWLEANVRVAGGQSGTASEADGTLGESGHA